MRTVRLSFRPLASLACIALVAALAGCATRSAAPVEDRRAIPRVQPPPSVGVPAAPSSPVPGVAAPAPSTSPAAEPDWRPQSYTVKRGDTLHAIALEHGLDYRELAAWNGIENPNLIRVGQVLRLAAPGEAVAWAPDPGPTGVTTAPLRTVPPVVEGKPAPPVAPTQPSTAPPTAATPPVVAPRNTDALKVSPKMVRERYTPELAKEMARAQPEAATIARADAPKPAPPPTSSPAPAATPTPAPPSPAPSSGASAQPPSPPRAASDDGDDIDWMWPAKGKLVTGFSDTANLKGIDIAGVAGQPVVASAAGRVVYAGSGLRGYGKLVIIKHNNTFLSAYAHNRDIVVKEGQQVARGQKIAEMGSTDTDQVKLHFEIRRLGRPMDPLKYLPPA
jgi:lipoprotein NlpD